MVKQLKRQIQGDTTSATTDESRDIIKSNKNGKAKCLTLRRIKTKRQQKVTENELAELTKSCSKRRADKFMEFKEHIKDRIKGGQSNSFYCFDLSEVKHRVEVWRKLMPRVQIRYATKANPDLEILKECFKLGCGFDVASSNEIKIVSQLGVKP